MQSGRAGGGLGDAVPVAGRDGGAGHHPRAADADHIGQLQISRRVLQRHAAGRAEFELRQRRGKGGEQRRPAGRLGGKNFANRSRARSAPWPRRRWRCPAAAAPGTGDGVQQRPVAPGETANCAPAATASSNCAGVRTVPAPTNASGTSSAMARIACSPAPVRKVTSIAGSPPPTSARASGTASFTGRSITTGMTGARRRIVCEVHALASQENARAGIGRADGVAEGGEQFAADAAMRGGEVGRGGLARRPDLPAALLPPACRPRRPGA